MSFADERQTIEQRFKDQWETGSPSTLRTTVGWDGHEFSPPRGSDSVRLTIRNWEAANKSIGSPGSNTVRYHGSVIIEIFTPSGEGSAQARTYIDLIRPIFTNWTSGTLRFRSMSVSDTIVDPPFYRTTVSFSFQRDEYHG